MPSEERRATVMAEERKGGTVHCPGCGRWVGVKNIEAGRLLEGLIWCEKCAESGLRDTKTPTPRKQLRCDHDNGWISVDTHSVFVNRLGELMVSGRTNQGRLLMQCNSGCGKTKHIRIPKVKLAGNQGRGE